ncbi:hypothetical protein MNB_SM-4-1253 [hydrothermal vent metagenome]|uniref:Uncharacterized protein n=1 Tax=hydrothermal vent metagenome TaxID=652676 RepID=A0A1W1CMF0_9ZZZZ
MSSGAGLTTKVYFELTPIYRACSEADYSGVQFQSGSTNIVAYYGN